MSTQWKVFIPSRYAASVETTQYASPSGLRSSIDKFTATNVSASAANITVRLVPSGSVAGVDNAITYQRTLVPGETYTFPELIYAVLEPGDFISTLASAASALVIRSSGRQAT